MEFWNNLPQRLKFWLSGVTVVIFFIAGILWYPKFVKGPHDSYSQEIPMPNTLSQISVYVTGAVERPGVYTLPHGSRVRDLLKLAGAKKNWDPEGINLAKRLDDEDMIVVPRIMHEANPARVNPAPTHPNVHSFTRKLRPRENLSLNKASLSDLEALPGVGPGMAKRIMDYRISHGSFGSIEDLRDVPGLGDKKFQRIKPYLRL